MPTDQILATISDTTTVPAAILAGGIMLKQLLTMLLDKYPAWRRARTTYKAFKIYMYGDVDEATRERALKVICVFAPEMLELIASDGGSPGG